MKIPYKNVLRQPWMTTGLLKSSKTRDILFRKCIGKPKQSQSYTNFIRYRNNFNRIKRVCKQNYYASELYKYKYNIQKTWNILKTLIGKNNNKSGISDTFKIDNTITKNASKISNKFCEYFSDIGNQFASKIPKPDKPFHHYLNHNTNYQRSIFMSPTDPEEISRIIASLKCKNSSGHDGISSKLLKSLQPALCLPISILINKSMETGQVPADMKIAKIIPIYKSKEKNNMGNYRPISLLPSVSKILEKAVHKRLYGFCETQHILYDNQYGFRPKHSTIDAVSKFSAHVMASLEDNLTTLAVFLDLSKAFDTIDHNILIKKTKFLWYSWYCLGVVQKLFDKQVAICILPRYTFC